MAYVYLLEMHKYIDNRLARANRSLAEKTNVPAESKFYEGQRDVLMDFKQYLSDIFNPKLPRRIRENYEREKKE